MRKESKPIKGLHPQLLEPAPAQAKLDGVLTPPLQNLVSNQMPEAEMQDRCGALSEWIAMVQLGSPRISTGDSVDPYLSRYSVPEFDQNDTVDLVSLKWRGLISSAWTMQLFLTLM
jgi:ribonuclease P/MRP protein subunit RPP40